TTNSRTNFVFGLLAQPIPSPFTLLNSVICYFPSLDTGNRRQHSTMTVTCKRWGSCTPCVPLHSRHEMLPPRIATTSRQTSWGICAVQPKPPRKHSTQTTINTTS
ncbi:unnamed protein product, partial [Ectocarpus fasciculatus]